MDNTKYLLVLAMDTGFGGDLLRIAAKVSGGAWDEQEMQYYGENDNLRDHLNLENHIKIVRVEEIHDVIV